MDSRFWNLTSFSMIRKLQESSANEDSETTKRIVKVKGSIFDEGRQTSCHSDMT